MHPVFKRTAALVAGLAVAASTVVTAELPAAAAPTCRTTFVAYKAIHRGDTGIKAKAVECLLADAGYKTSINGKISSSDAKAIARFRSSIGLSPINVVGRKAWSALLAQGSTPTLRAGAKGADVRRVQYALRAARFRTVPVNAKMDAATVAIIKSAQRHRGLRQTGVVDASFWRALQQGRITVSSSAKAPAKKAPAKKATVKKKKAPAKKKASSSSKGVRALAFARKQLGDRYAYGAQGPNAWDCSGLTGGAWKSVGVKIPRTSQAQYRFGKKISKSNLRKGDLVFFYRGISHVALYAGNGKVIHASRPGKPVHYLPMKYMPYQGARRPG